MLANRLAFETLGKKQETLPCCWRGWTCIHRQPSLHDPPRSRDPIDWASRGFLRRTPKLSTLRARVYYLLQGRFSLSLMCFVAAVTVHIRICFIGGHRSGPDLLLLLQRKRRRDDYPSNY